MSRRKCRPVEQEIRAGHHPAVGGGQDRRVVADPDQGWRPLLVRPQHGGHLLDKAELTQRGHGLPVLRLPVLRLPVLRLPVLRLPVLSDRSLPRVSPVYGSTVP